MITKYDIGQQIMYPATIKGINIEQDGSTEYLLEFRCGDRARKLYIDEETLEELNQ